MSEPKQRRVSRFFATNQVMKSTHSERYYFVRKVELMPNGVGRVIGKKVDVTESIEFILKDAKKRKKKVKDHDGLQ